MELTDFSGLGRGTGSRVGEPRQELALTNALALSLPRLFRPRPGRTSFVLFEPEIGRGRPDAVVVQMSSAALQSFRRRHLRVPHLTAARSLVVSASHGELGISQSYLRQLRTAEFSADWSDTAILHASGLIRDSLAIEAKVKDWRRGLRQVAAFRPYAHRSALLLPDPVAQRLDSSGLAVYTSGLMSERGGQVEWLHPAPRRELDAGVSLWLLELIIRGLEDGSTHNASELAKAARAALKLSTRVE